MQGGVLSYMSPTTPAAIEDVNTEKVRANFEEMLIKRAHVIRS